MDFAKSDVWEKSMRLAELACTLSGRLGAGQKSTMKGQMTRAAISVPSNIAEGWRRDSAKEKAHFFSIAHGSLAELQTQVLLCRRLGWAADAESARVLQLANDVGAMLAALRQSWKNKAKHGTSKPAS
jgi:four helix bundle protein